MIGDNRCPECGAELDDIGGEKTVVCDECGLEWKWDSGMEWPELVEPNDPIHCDR
jgi:hypothetical protein